MWFDEKIFVDSRATRYRDTCAIYVERNVDSERIEFGDRFWWQGAYAFWTPADESRVEVKIPRVGFSGVILERKEKALG